MPTNAKPSNTISGIDAIVYQTGPFEYVVEVYDGHTQIAYTTAPTRDGAEGLADALVTLAHRIPSGVRKALHEAILDITVNTPNHRAHAITTLRKAIADGGGKP